MPAAHYPSPLPFSSCVYRIRSCTGSCRSLFLSASPRLGLSLNFKRVWLSLFIDQTCFGAQLRKSQAKCNNFQNRALHGYRWAQPQCSSSKSADTSCRHVVPGSMRHNAGRKLQPRNLLAAPTRIHTHGYGTRSTQHRDHTDIITSCLLATACSLRIHGTKAPIQLSSHWHSPQLCPPEVSKDNNAVLSRGHTGPDVKKRHQDFMHPQTRQTPAASRRTDSRRKTAPNPPCPQSLIRMPRLSAAAAAFSAALALLATRR